MSDKQPGGDRLSSIALRRIVGLEQKNRIQRSVHIEDELHKVMIENELPISNVINIALEQYLTKQGLIK